MLRYFDVTEEDIEMINKLCIHEGSTSTTAFIFLSDGSILEQKVDSPVEAVEFFIKTLKENGRW